MPFRSVFYVSITLFAAALQKKGAIILKTLTTNISIEEINVDVLRVH